MHFLDLLGLADVALQRQNLAAAGTGHFGRGLLDDFAAASADCQIRSQAEQTLAHGSPQAGAATGHDDLLILKRIRRQHRLGAARDCHGRGSLDDKGLIGRASWAALAIRRGYRETSRADGRLALNH